MESQNLPRLKYFMSCYYHQDWALEAGSTNECDLWDSYFKSEKLNTDEELLSDVRALLEEHNDLILKKLSEFQSSGRYWRSPNEAKQWLNDLEQYLNSRSQNIAHHKST